MEYNLLKMTQLILSSMDSDEINSIDDTVESRQVVDIIETTFNDLVSAISFPTHWDLYRLDNFGDVTRPTLLVIPTGINEIEWIKYDVAEDGATARDFRTLTPMSRFEFFERMESMDTDDSDVISFEYEVGAQSFTVHVKNDEFPTYYTTVDNDTLLFDSYDASVQTTLTGGRTMCYATKTPTFTRSDTFVPDLDAKHFTILFNEAKSSCWADLKQTQNSKAEQRARRGWVNANRHKSAIQTRPALDEIPNYGRGRRRPSGLSLPPKAQRGW